ncbi:MAG: major capsid protein [Desulfobulbaceae bacterium]|nr:major capsid protein [Desulfobulbaceae bacterium]
MITRHLTNGSLMVDWDSEINEIDNQYGLFNGMGLFESKGISTETVLFDKNTTTVTMIPQTSRTQSNKHYGKDRKLETFSLITPYFKHGDEIHPTDVQGWRKGGTPDTAEDLGNVRMEKMENMKLNADQTKEYMKISAIKGKTVDPDGTTLADMFTEFGISQKAIDFALGTQTTKVDLKITELTRYIAANAKAGGALGDISVACSPEFFDALTTHPNMISAYLYYSQTGPQLNRDSLQEYRKWGVVDTFTHKGLTFFSYDATFLKPDGDTVRAFGVDTTDLTKQEGYSLVKGMRGLYKGYYGPANTLSGVNVAGTEMYLREYRDPKDKFIELELEMAPLFVMTKPQCSVRVHSST